MKEKTTAARLKSIMESEGLRQIDILNRAKPFCKKYNVKLGRNDISQYVSGKIEPSRKKINVLAKGLNVDPVWLMGYEVPKTEFYKHDFISDDKELLKKALKETGILNKNEDISEKNIKLFIEFIKANKNFIIDNTEEKK